MQTSQRVLTALIVLALLVAALVAAAVITGCSGTPSPYAVTEPIFVHEGVFRSGELPVAPVAADGTVSGPQITDFENANAIVQWGQAGKSLDGRTTPDAYAVAIRLAGAGTGYFIVPVGAADPTNNGERVFTVTVDFARDLTTGLGALELVAIDQNGEVGPLTMARLCIVSGLPGGDSACDPEAKTPLAVVQLTWDTNVDLDLAVLSQTGVVVDWSHPSSDTASTTSPGAAVITRNSNAGCVIDGINREEIVWQTLPPPGGWLTYVNLFDACGQESVNYQVTLFTQKNGVLVETARSRGILDALQANGGATLGTFALEFAFK
jgi:hypothetical protein